MGRIAIAREFVVGISGASGAIYGVELLRALRAAGARTHLIVSPTAAAILPVETGLGAAVVEALADHVYRADDLFAPVASGSFVATSIDGMAIVPCSMKTLAAVAHGFADNLISRAADVMIKEHRRLVLVPRETPLSPIHLRNMLTLAELGAVVLPPMPAFYTRPTTVTEIVQQTVSRVLDHLGLPGAAPRWTGLPADEVDEG
ncbi:MAG: UbiX family flavin prenyltransferase [Chloroflexota bacterium]